MSTTTTTPPRSSTTATTTTTTTPTNVCVIVLGDLGRSPRMQYHVKSFQQHCYNVDIISYIETSPLKEITNHPTTIIHKLNPFPPSQLPGLLKYLFKMMWQFLTLMCALISIRRPQFILCQNPPGIPAIMVCQIYCALMRCHLIIDWHNYTHSILALGSGGGSGGGGGGGGGGHLIKFAKWLEFKFGKKSWANLCVTKAMQKDLMDNWDIKATVLYDRPMPNFRPISIEAKHELFIKLSKQYPEFMTTISSNDEDEGFDVIELTAFTKRDENGLVSYRKKRKALLVSSTSWTEDEDFGILLNALEDYENIAAQSSNYPSLLCCITGKGPMKEYYLKKIKEKSWEKIEILTPWLENDDYPLLLAAADLGVCLHTSSSGLDLPMKVVDMFGCGLPVCAIKFNCLNELVRNEENGFVFETSHELGEQLLHWFHYFPNNKSLVNVKETFQTNLRKFQALRWTENWNQQILPLLNVEN